MPGGGNGYAWAGLGAGVILAWSGIKGANVTATLQNVVKGSPPTGSEDNPLTAAPTGGGNGGSAVNPNPPGTATVAAYKAYARLLLAAHGWAGQWDSFNAIVMEESGWDAEARNSSSGAYGIAQALGHGTATTRGTEANEYGDYGTPDAVCRAANSGNGNAQIQWMLNYIGKVYGSPDAAQAYHLAHNSY